MKRTTISFLLVLLILGVYGQDKSFTISKGPLSSEREVPIKYTIDILPTLQDKSGIIGLYQGNFYSYHFTQTRAKNPYLLKFKEFNTTLKRERIREFKFQSKEKLVLIDCLMLEDRIF
ncbi:MAG: hypothetical protein AB8H47_13420 [Bacteroidia bacterium]